MRRRELIALGGGAAMLLPLTLAAQSSQHGKVYRLGELAPSSISLEYTRNGTLPELAALGFAEGRNLVLHERAERRARNAKVCERNSSGEPGCDSSYRRGRNTRCN